VVDIEGAALLALGRTPDAEKTLRMAAEAKPDDLDVASLLNWADPVGRYPCRISTSEGRL